MLTYLIYVTEGLITTALLVGIALAYARAAGGTTSTRIVLGATVAGLVAAAVMAFMKHTTSLIDTGTWNMHIFIVAAVAAVVFLVTLIGPIARSKVGRVVMPIALGLFVFLRVFYKVPDVYVYPFNFVPLGSNFMSTDFALKLTGYLLGLVLVCLACVSVFKFTKSLGRVPLGIAAAGTVGILAVVQVMTCLQTMLARRMITNNHELFQMVKWFSNNSTLFIFIIMGIMVALAIMTIVLSLRDNEPYSNPAEHRKIKATWRNRRRWAICLIACTIAASLVVTVVKDYENRGPELSPSEEFELRDGNCYVTFGQLEDGHLHRFTYTTEAGVDLGNGKTTQGGVGVRFIIIKKPGSNAYGVGLDACEICGQTGYYERDGQVVCKLCDVVMNINTIGFKGGCNPIPVEYKIADGCIIIPTSALSAYEKTFK